MALCESSHHARGCGLGCYNQRAVAVCHSPINANQEKSASAGMQEREDLSELLQQALAECARLREENARLKALQYPPHDQTAPAPETVSPASNTITPEIISDKFTPEAKVTLFQSLFRGREDVYALRWESKNGRSGYSPACIREWEQDADGKFKLKNE